MAKKWIGIQKQYPLRRLVTEYKQLITDPDSQWFRIIPVEDFVPYIEGDIKYVCKWNIEIIGFEGTMYEGYTLCAEMLFPSDYPLSPPKVVFTTRMYHPNIYEDGKVCISILHTARTDPYTDELDTEQWTPALSVRTVLLSIVLILNEPNVESPANLDASIHFRSSKKEYEEYVKSTVLPHFANKLDL
ncbi:hypothetical protein NEOKW01_0619 [Nematocida sp. AWRm80]|nr:hypothetical protein NEOKW01_0619 [Nematocida sp. AWRm80]